MVHTALADIRPAPRADDKRFPYSGCAHIGGGPELGRRHRRGKAAEAPKHGGGPTGYGWEALTGSHAEEEEALTGWQNPME